MENRKIIQIIEAEECLAALCNDGTLWYLSSGRWSLVKADIPQGDVSKHLIKS